MTELTSITDTTRRFAAAVTVARPAFESAGRALASMVEELNRPRVWGLKVEATPRLPGPAPTDREDASRIVRHGLADVLEWLGEPVGPEPGERQHAAVSMDMRILWVSHELYERILVDGPPPFAVPSPAFRRDVVTPVRRAMVRAELLQLPVVSVWGVKP